MSCRSRIRVPRGVVIRWSTDTKHNAPVLPVFIVTSAMREVRVISSPTRNASKNSSSPPAHIRRGSGTGGRKPPRVGWPSWLSADIGNTGCARHQCTVHGAASPGFGSPISRTRGARRPTPRLRLADLLEQGRAQALPQLGGNDVGGLGAAADPLAQMVEVEFFRELFGHDVLLRARAGSVALPWPPIAGTAP